MENHGCLKKDYHGTTLERGRLERAAVAGKAFVSYLFGKSKSSANEFKEHDVSGETSYKRYLEKLKAKETIAAKKKYVVSDSSKEADRKREHITKSSKSSGKKETVADRMRKHAVDTSKATVSNPTSDNKKKSVGKSMETTEQLLKKRADLMFKEYRQEAADNERKNPDELKTVKRSSTTTSTSRRPTQASSEYWEELAYNSKTNRRKRKVGR